MDDGVPRDEPRDVPGPEAGRRGVALAAAGLVVLDYPVLAVLDRDGLVLGLPTAWAAVVVAWAVLVALLAVVMRRA